MVKYTSVSSFNVMPEKQLTACGGYLQHLNNAASSPFFWDGLCHRATFPWRGDDLDVVGGKLDQISQRARVDDGRVSDEVLFKIHRLHCLCEGNLLVERREEKWGTVRERTRLTQLGFFPNRKTLFFQGSEPSRPISQSPGYIYAVGE